MLKSRQFRGHTPTVALALGVCSRLGRDYGNDDGFLFDAVQQGAIMGLTIRF